MPQNLLHMLLYALISGFTEFLGVSAPPHQILYNQLFGLAQSDAMLTLFVRLGVLVAVLICCRARINRLLREYRLSSLSRHRRNRQPDVMAQLDIRLLKTAMIPLLISVLFYMRAGEWITKVQWLAVTLTLNGIVIFIPRLISLGNKDGRSVSRLDGVVMGLGGALAAIPGFSRIGCILSAGLVRGIDRGYALDMALLLSIPTLLGLLIFDVYAVIVAGATVGALMVLIYLLAAAIAFGSAWLGIKLMRYLSVKAGFTGFSYYCWGLALFSFILYLMI